MLAPTGSTGNNTHNPASVSIESVLPTAVQFVVEVAGATPTVTWKAQGSMDGTNWYDLFYITDATDTSAAAARVATAVGAQIEWLALAPTRNYAQFRVVTSLNTNVTYRAELYIADSVR